MQLMHRNDNVVRTFQLEDLCDIGMQLFFTAGHTLIKEPVIKNRKIKEFVYFDIHHSQVLTNTDWNALNKVELISLLFTNDTNFINANNHDEFIDYLAVSLCTHQSYRSILAYEVHLILSRILQSNYSIVLFEANGYLMLSFAERFQNKRKKVVLSNWYTQRDIFDKELAVNIDAAYFSSNSIREFFYDFEYAAARSYYIYPISYEYAGYEMFPINFFEEFNVDIVDRETMNEINTTNYLLPKLEYKEDYVDNDQYNQELQEYSTDDITLDLLEFEPDNLQLDDKEDEEEDEYSQNDDEIDEDIFNDPIKTLKWLETHSIDR